MYLLSQHPSYPEIPETANAAKHESDICKQRTLSASLTLQYDKLLYLVDSTPPENQASPQSASASSTVPMVASKFVTKAGNWAIARSTN
jgi:hypothetical protein